MPKVSFYILASLALAFGAHAKPPNILVIVSDDQGYSDLGLLGNGIITPNLDRIAAGGTRLTDFYVTWPACTPSRAGFLTGRYPQRNGIFDMIRNEAPDYGHRYTPEEYAVTFERIGGMDRREKIIPQFLEPRGYRSAIYGKWDLGSLGRFLPTSRGFDDFYGFVNTGIDYYTHERYGVPSMYRNLEPTTADRGTYATTLFEREALRFLREHDPEIPFFLYVPFNAPHNSSSLDPAVRSTIQAPEDFKKRYPPVAPEYRTTDSYRYGNPARIVTSKARTRDYRAAVTCMDEAVGRMLDLLESRSHLDDTIIVFFSDNGGGGGSDNTPLRGRKAQMWEGGIRVPCIVHWRAGRIPAGKTSDAFLTSLEILPSLLAATGTAPPPDITLDGHDWWPTLRDGAPSPRTEMFWKRKNHRAARVGHWKWLDTPEHPDHLVDLRTDIAERNNLALQHPGVLARVRSRFQAWWSEMQSAEPRGPFKDF